MTNSAVLCLGQKPRSQVAERGPSRRCCFCDGEINFRKLVARRLLESNLLISLKGREMNNKKKSHRGMDLLFCLTEGGTVVHRDKIGKVSPLWLGACEAERTQTEGIMEQIADPLNLEKAYRRVKANAGKGGVDGREVKELGAWLSKNLYSMREQLLQGHYERQPVRGVKIPKPQGGYRQLGIPTVTDRLAQQAIHPVLTDPLKLIHRFVKAGVLEVMGMVRWLRKLGVEETVNWRTALSGKSWWRLSNSPASNMGMNNQWFTEQGYYSLYAHYQALNRKPTLKKPLDTQVRPVV